MKVTLNVLSGYLKEGSLLLVAKKWLFGQCNSCFLAYQKKHFSSQG
jgi:hypothetical protein